MIRLEVDDYPTQLQQVILEGSTPTYVAKLDELEEGAGGSIYYVHEDDGMNGCYGAIFKVQGTQLFHATDDPVWDFLLDLMGHFAHHCVEKAKIDLSLFVEGVTVRWPTI